MNPKATLSWEYRGNFVEHEQILDFLHRPVTTDSKEEAFLLCLVHFILHSASKEWPSVKN